MNFKSFLCVVACVLAVAVSVAPGGAEAMQASPAQKQEMMEHYERATRAYDIQKYQEAVEEYQKAYEIAGDPAMLYNVAQAYRLNGQLTEALHSYRRYLQRSPNARNREDVERKIADLEQTIETRRKAAEAEAAAARQARTPVTTPPAAVETPPVQAPQPPPSESSTNGKRVAGIVVLSVGAAAVAVAGVSGWLAAKKGDDLTGASMRGERFDPDVQSAGKTWNAVAIGSAIGGGVLAVVGTILIVAAGGESGDKPAEAHGTALLTPVVGGGTFGMGAGITF
jgi:tetratricopeptide (TPR) repeat protein